MNAYVQMGDVMLMQRAQTVSEEEHVRASLDFLVMGYHVQVSYIHTSPMLLSSVGKEQFKQSCSL